MADGPGGARRRARPRLLLLLALAWLGMLLPAVLSFQKQLACAIGWCEQQPVSETPLLRHGDPGSDAQAQRRSAIEASGGSSSSSGTSATLRASQQVRCPGLPSSVIWHGDLALTWAPLPAQTPVRALLPAPLADGDLDKPLPGSGASMDRPAAAAAAAARTFARNAPL